MKLLGVIIARVLNMQKKTVSCLSNAQNVVVIMNLETQFDPIGLKIKFSALIDVPTSSQATANVQLF